MAVNRKKVSRSVSFSARIHSYKVSKAVNLLKTGVRFDGLVANHLILTTLIFLTTD